MAQEELGIPHGGSWSLAVEKLPEGHEQHLFSVGCVEGEASQVEEVFWEHLLCRLCSVALLIPLWLPGKDTCPRILDTSTLSFQEQMSPWLLRPKICCRFGETYMNLVSTDSLWDQGQVALPRMSRFPDLSALRVGGEH